MAILISVYAISFLIVLLLPIIELAKLVIASLMFVGLIYYLRRDAWLRLPSSIVAIRVESGVATLITRGGSEISGDVSGDSLVTSRLTVLNVSQSGSKRTSSVVIFSDSLDKELFRQLRVLLKWGDIDVKS